MRLPDVHIRMSEMHEHAEGCRTAALLQEVLTCHPFSFRFSDSKSFRVGGPEDFKSQEPTWTRLRSVGEIINCVIRKRIWKE